MKLNGERRKETEEWRGRKKIAGDVEFGGFSASARLPR